MLKILEELRRENSMYDIKQDAKKAQVKILKLVMSKKPKKKECNCGCTRDTWGCECGAENYNQALQDYTTALKGILSTQALHCEGKINKGRTK